MLLTIEKVLILSGVDFFSDLRSELLAEISFLFEEEEFLAGETIIKKGDYGNTMFIVVYGKVSVRDGDKELAIFQERDVFGELAALEPEIRTASVIAVEDALLLKIDHDAFYELIFDHNELSRSVIRFLIQRYRSILMSAGT